MKHAHSLEEVQTFVHEEQMSLVYISRPNCSVCVSLLPQVENLLESYPSVNSIYVNADEITEIAGEYSIFTVPVVIVFAEGKEMLRKARFVPMDELEHQISKLYSLIF